MLNILSLNCGFAFAPYLIESISAFLNDGASVSRVIRQGGSGLIIRSADRITIRHQNRHAELSSEELRHYLATIKFRNDRFEIQRMSGEVVLANFDPGLLISHPQSDLWLDTPAVKHLLELGGGRRPTSDPVAGLPHWLSVSSGAGQLLISDQRNGRWVLLGSDHIAELKRRTTLTRRPAAPEPPPKAPTILLKGVTVHLQSAARLLESLQVLGDKGEVSAFEEVAPSFSLRVARSVEGIELSDSNSSVGMNGREARKWSAVVRDELERFNVSHVERGLIRTVFADGEGGRWVLQWGDEVFVPAERLSTVSGTGRDAVNDDASPGIRYEGGFVLLLSLVDAACVALNQAELQRLTGSAGDCAERVQSSS